MSERIYTAAVVIIGNEVLSGRVVDANLNFLAVRLKAQGIRLREARVIPDVKGTIVSCVNELRAAHDYVFTTGGIGPTHDDITAESIAAGFPQGSHASDPSGDGHGPGTADEPRAGLANVVDQGDLEATCNLIATPPPD